jgi:hypothetical protein
MLSGGFPQLGGIDPSMLSGGLPQLGTPGLDPSLLGAGIPGLGQGMPGPQQLEMGISQMMHAMHTMRRLLRAELAFQNEFRMNQFGVPGLV